MKEDKNKNESAKATVKKASGEGDVKSTTSVFKPVNVSVYTKAISYVVRSEANDIGRMIASSKRTK